MSNAINLCLKRDDAGQQVLPLKNREKRTLWAMGKGDPGNGRHRVYDNQITKAS